MSAFITRLQNEEGGHLYEIDNNNCAVTFLWSYGNDFLLRRLF